MKILLLLLEAITLVLAMLSAPTDVSADVRYRRPFIGRRIIPVIPRVIVVPRPYVAAPAAAQVYAAPVETEESATYVSPPMTAAPAPVVAVVTPRVSVRVPLPAVAVRRYVAPVRGRARVYYRR